MGQLPAPTLQNLAELFPLLVRDITAQFGDAGIKLLGQTLRQYGRAEGKRVRETVQSLGLKPDLDSFLRFHPGVIGRRVNIVRSPDNCGFDICHCPLEVLDLEEQNIEVRRLVCVLDLAIIEGFNPNLVHHHSSCLRLGSESCYLVSRIVS
ncbi:MAG TPA: L-2-amino-thiazoline-4-carboxylic acid hydrolase [Bacillota bacterium]|nr:L-2-amino-thiazoline-4-carboxylic acid hydrolase [Bacillota bacterium]